MRFLLAALAAVLMTIILSVLFVVSKPFDRKNRIFPFIAYWWSKAVFVATGIKVRAAGLERLDTSRPYVYVSNHASVFDIIGVVVAIDRHIRFIAKKEVARIPVFGWIAASGYIMVDRTSGPDGARSLERAAGRIAAGESVILFAEGTRTRDGNLLPFKRGAFSLAIQAGVPVVPLTILGSYDVMKKGELRIRKGEITIVVDSPIDVREYHDRQGAMALMNRVREVIERNYTAGKALPVQASACSG